MPRRYPTRLEALEKRNKALCELFYQHFEANHRLKGGFRDFKISNREVHKWFKEQIMKTQREIEQLEQN